MATKSHRSGNSEDKKIQLSLSEDDSVSLHIIPPRKQRAMHTDFDIQYEEDDRKLLMFLEIDPKMITNLSKEIVRIKQFSDERSQYKNCIFLKKIETPLQTKGEFVIFYTVYKGLTFTVRLEIKQEIDEAKTYDMYAKMKLYYQNNQKWDSKFLQVDIISQNKTQSYNFNLPAGDLQQTLKQKLLLQVTFAKNVPTSYLYGGMNNIGNSCYANSIIQVLFHIVSIRKLIVQLPKSKLKKLTTALQQLFVCLIQKKSCDAERILDSLLVQYQKNRQQDIHQFLIQFISQLQSEVPQISQIWKGKDFQTTFSKVHEYSSKQQEDFVQLQLFMSDLKGVNFRSIHESLKHLLVEQESDDPIDTDDFGKISVWKKRGFSYLPPVLFMNIKRYSYNPKRRQLKKIDQELTFTQKINLDFLMNTPEGLEYVLHSVVVHKGLSPNSGHYFSLVNVSPSISEPDWHEFNDSVVRKVTAEKVLHEFNGKQKLGHELDKQFGRWVQKYEKSEQTAYLLVYMRQDIFEETQKWTVTVPSWQMERLSEKLAEQQFKTLMPVKIYLLNNLKQFNPFGADIDASIQQFKLSKDATFEEELKKRQKTLGCDIGTIWKVNTKLHSIKNITKSYGKNCHITIGQHILYKKNLRQPDYFIIIPKEFMQKIDDFQYKKIGILHIFQQKQDENTDYIEIHEKKNVQARLEQFKQEGANIEINQQEFDQFIYEWNDYLKVTKS